MDYVGQGEPFTLVRTGVGPIRGFPCGLDAMDLLGSERAREILVAEGDTQYALYEEPRQKLIDEFAALPVQDWNRNLYWGWLYSLKALLGVYGPGYPAFLQTAAWRDKSLNTALASWTELRHDTILYAKQSYTPLKSSLPPLVRGYVEPAPEFYARLLELSLKELRNEALTSEDYVYIREIGGALEQTVLGVRDAGVKTTLIADVHTDANSQKVLEEGVGYVDLLAAVIPQPDGTPSLAHDTGERAATAPALDGLVRALEEPHRPEACATGWPGPWGWPGSRRSGPS